jgi:CRP-like cAMP-binding protein
MENGNCSAISGNRLNANGKTILTAAGETEKHLYFVLEGLQRAFYIGDDQKEATIVFTYPPSFSGVADSFFNTNSFKILL